MSKSDPEKTRLRRLIRKALDALDAEKTPDYGVGHDRAVAALVEALLGEKPGDPFEGARETPLDELPARWVKPHDALKYELGDPMNDERKQGVPIVGRKCAEADCEEHAPGYDQFCRQHSPPDWICGDCGCRERWDSAFCYRCGAGRPEKEEESKR